MQNIVSFFLVVVGAFFPVFCFFLSTIELCRLPLVAPVRSGPAKTECVAFAVRYNFDNSVLLARIFRGYASITGRTDGRSFALSLTLANSNDPLFHPKPIVIVIIIMTSFHHHEDIIM